MKTVLILRIVWAVLWILGKVTDKNGNGIPDFLEDLPEAEGLES